MSFHPHSDPKAFPNVTFWCSGLYAVKKGRGSVRTDCAIAVSEAPFPARESRPEHVMKMYENNKMQGD
jgi:hypothetical protein